MKKTKVTVTFDKFDKAKNKDKYVLLNIKEVAGFRVVSFQVDLPPEERTFLNNRLAVQAFLN